MKKFLLSSLLISFTFNGYSLSSGHVITKSSSQDITSDDGTCIKVTNNCTDDVFVPFKTLSEVSTNMGNTPSCIVEDSCGPSGFTWNSFNASAAPAPAWSCTYKPSPAACAVSSVALSDGYYARYAYVNLPTPLPSKTWSITFKAAGGDHNETSYINGTRGSLVITNTGGTEITVWQKCMSTNGTGSANWHNESISYTGDIASIRLHSERYACPGEVLYPTAGGEFTRIDNLVIN